MKRANPCVMAAGLSIALSAFAAAPSYAQGEAALAKPRPVNPAMFAPAAALNNRPTSIQQRDERRFLKDAAATGRFESEASRLALGKSSNANVRTFAATLINHHTAAGNELVHMLHVRGMAAPMLGNDQRKTLNRLAKLQGAKFDREFMQELGLRNQQDNVEMFEKAGHSARDPQLKAWIDKTLPTLRYHLTIVERMVPADSRLARSMPAAVAQPATQTLTADPFVSRASLATRSMGASPAPLGLTPPAPKKPTGSSTR